MLVVGDSPAVTGDSVQKTFFPSELRDKSDKTDIRNVHTLDIVVKILLSSI